MADKRPMRAKVTPWKDEDAAVLESFSGIEAISAPFRFTLNLLTQPDTEIEFDKILGQAVSVTIDMPKGGFRYFNGIAYRITQGPQVRADEDKKAFTRLQIEIVPSFFLLKLIVQSRIFQHMTVPDILKKVVTGFDVTWSDVKGTFEEREYCVQYRESDYAFACRLMEEEGIYYYFVHTKDAHKMIVANSPDGHQSIQAKISYDDVGGGQYDEDVISIWEKSQEVRSGKYTLRDHCFEDPEKNYESQGTVTPSAAAGTITQKLEVATNKDKFEVYDFPGLFAHRFDGINKTGGDQAAKLGKIAKDGERTVGLRMEQETMHALTIFGHSTCRQLRAGYKITLDKHYHGDGKYVLTQVQHNASIMGTARGGRHGSVGGKLRYQNDFWCLPVAIPFRPLQVTPKARVQGLQTGVVVGPSGQEIFTDKYSRVKVQFLWDRLGKNDADSSCWLRVSTPLAGQQWGMVHIPRIGQEVIVAFLEGDPDQPIIVGSVYNAKQMPPYDLDKKVADNKAKLGLKTRSTPNGDQDTFNELRFEDKKGVEEIYFHAEKDFTRVVENNDWLEVGYKEKKGDHKSDDGSQYIKIYKDRSVELEQGNDTLLISKGNCTITIKGQSDSKGKRTTVVESDETLQVQKGKRDVKIDKGDDLLTIGTGSCKQEINKDFIMTVKTGDATIKINAGACLIQAAKSLELKVGGSSVKLEPAAITLKIGPSTIKLEPAKVSIQGVQVEVAGTAMATVKAAIAKLAGDGMVMVKGGVAMIN